MDARAIPTPRPDCLYTEHPFSQVVMAAFAQGCGGRYVPIQKENGRFVACYGVLRGCLEAMRAADGFWYIDHSYFAGLRPFSGRSMFDGSLSRTTMQGFYRVVRDGFWHDSVSTGDDTRLKAFGVVLKDWRKAGSHVVVVPPSPVQAKIHGLERWQEQTIRQLRLFTDRPVAVNAKSGSRPLSEDLKDAWCLVTDHSNAGIDALVEGVPVIYTNPQRRLGSIAEIESPPMERAFLCHLANNCWSLDEMASGEQWNHAESSAGLYRLR